MPDLFDSYSHAKPSIFPQIYVFEEPSVAELKGMLCVGYTTRENVEDRIAEEFKAAPVKQWHTLYTESAVREDGSCFMDYDVHAILDKWGVPHLKSHTGGSSEWFKTDLKKVKAAILAVKDETENVEYRTATFGMRPEQIAAVNMTQDYFEKYKDDDNIKPKFLWNCKMRFGKTFATYELAKRMGMKRVLILTFKPAVEASWEEDLMTHVDFEGWQFYSRHSDYTPKSLKQDKPIVCFGSFQDYLGTNERGGIKAHNEWVHETHWDLVVFDEYHFGAWRDTAQKLFKPQDDEDVDFDAESYQEKEAGNAINETFLPIETDYYLYLSGTPFKALNSGEFLENEIYSWTYSDEQKAKRDWDDKNGPNPYAALPKIVMMTYKMPDDIRRIAMNTEYNEFDLNEFFKAETTSGNPKDAQFKYKEYVQKWLDLIRGAHMPTTVDDLKLGKNKPVMPYSDVRMLNILMHTVWFLPNVNACYAMNNLLQERANVFYHDYAINVCAGTAAGVGLDALPPVRASMADPLESKSITLTCGKLTTGVTIKPWTGIFMLRNLSSPETYFQAAFRVQSPWTMKDDANKEQIIKKECYIFDFALDRALKMVSDYSCRLNINESNPEKKVGDFIDFLPILAYDGSTMKPISASEVLDIAMAGTSATLLARRWESALLVNVDNATLQRLMDNEEAMKALMSIEGFRSLNQDIQTIINKSDAVKKARKTGENLTPDGKQTVTEAEKEYKSKRKQIQEKLIKFATRIPIFMYLTDHREYSLKDVITQFEPNLFKKVTGLTVKDFELLVSLGVFNDSMMNDAVYKFKRYEDSSLEYTGLRMHSDKETVGLFSTTITAEEYEDLARQQGLSMNKSKAITVSRTEESPAPVHIEPKTEPVRSKIATESDVKTVDKAVSMNPKQKYKHIDVGTKIKHKTFGKGYVVQMLNSRKMMKIKFYDSDSEKNFVFPDAFVKGFIEEDK